MEHTPDNTLHVHNPSETAHTPHSHQHKGKSSERFMIKEAILAALGVAPGQTVLDAGCGNGYMAKEFSRLVGPRGEVTALDPDADSIGELRAQPRETNLKAIVGDITTNTGLSTGSFDLVYLSNVVHGFQKPQFEAFMKEVRRLLAPKGRLAIVEFVKEETPFGPPMEIRLSAPELISAVGLPPQGPVVRVGEYHYLQIFENPA